jgi:hypothetical protein
MGKRKFAKGASEARRYAPGAMGGPSMPPPPSSAFEAMFDERVSDEPGLCVHRRRHGVVYHAAYVLVVFLFLGTTVTLGSSTLPRLLSHWTWLIFSLYSLTLFGCRWFAEEAEAWVTFWLTPMVHGLLWMALVLVPVRGVAPGALWHAFGEHAGHHLLIAQIGTIPLLLLPPLVLGGYLWWEADFITAIFHDFYSQLARGQRKWNLLWHLLSPTLPFAIWAACLKTTVFTDLPPAVSTLEIVAVCLVANGPLLVYLHYRTRVLTGATHWIDGGAVLWCVGRGRGLWS